MGKRLDCIRKGTYTKDGIKVQGHLYEPLIAFEDVDNNRWYFVDKCQHCGHANVVFSDGQFSGEAERYPEVTQVGGLNEKAA